jgi:hypothetical protein
VESYVELGNMTIRTAACTYILQPPPSRACFAASGHAGHPCKQPSKPLPTPIEKRRAQIEYSADVWERSNPFLLALVMGSYYESSYKHIGKPYIDKLGKGHPDETISAALWRMELDTSTLTDGVGLHGISLTAQGDANG